MLTPTGEPDPRWEPVHRTGRSAFFATIYTFFAFMFLYVALQITVMAVIACAMWIPFFLLFLLQDAWRKNKDQVIKFAMVAFVIGLAIAAKVDQVEQARTATTCGVLAKFDCATGRPLQ